MTVKVIALTALVVLALCLPLMVESSVAAPLPDYFADEWAGLLCLTGTPPGGSQTSVLVQLNFDKSTNGGITTTAAADSLFAQIAASLPTFGGSNVWFGGSTPQQTCSFRPSQVQSQFGLNGLSLAQPLSGLFQSQFGFARYVILDSFYSLVPGYLQLPPGALTLRTDAFVVNGSNNVSYTGSSETLKSLLLP